MTDALNVLENIFNYQNNQKFETISCPYHQETFFPEVIYPNFDFSSLQKDINDKIDSDNECLEQNKNTTFNFDKILFNNNSNEPIELNKNQKPKFFTFKINKYIGRKRKVKKDCSFNELKEKEKKIHGKFDFDNILTKIQVHFINFIINIANDAIKVIYKSNKLKFMAINYQFKSKITFNHFNTLKKGPIKRIIMQEISNKYRKYEKNNNSNVLNEVIKESEWLDKFFNMNFMFLFSKYHNNCKILKKIVFEDKEIKLSRKTKSFNDLLKKYKTLKASIISIAQKAYFDGKKNRKENTFITNLHKN